MARTALSILLATLACGAALAAAEPQKPAKEPAKAAAAPAAASMADAREVIVLTAAERAHMLQGMRTYLEALQGIVEALAENKLAGVAENAKRAGAKMIQDAPASVPLKAPIGFTAMSLNTHEKFDVLAERAGKSASRSEVLTALAEIMANCTSCHAAYRAVAAN